MCLPNWNVVLNAHSTWVEKSLPVNASWGGKPDFNQIKEQTRSRLLWDIRKDGIPSWVRVRCMSFVRVAMFQHVFHIGILRYVQMCPGDRGEQEDEEEDDETIGLQLLMSNWYLYQSESL